MAERFKAPVLKTGVAAMSPWVRIPLPPPLPLAKAFSPSGCGRIFSLYSRVMREGLSTGSDGRRPGSGLSGPIFSGPDDCAVLVFSFQTIEITTVNPLPAEHFDFRVARREGTEIEQYPCR